MPVTDSKDQKGLTFRNKNIGTDEFFSLAELEGRTFDSIAVELWERLRRKRGGFREGVGNESQAPERQVVRFTWETPQGTMEPITGATPVLRFMHQEGVRIVHYYADTIGVVVSQLRSP